MGIALHFCSGIVGKTPMEFVAKVIIVLIYNTCSIVVLCSCYLGGSQSVQKTVAKYECQKMAEREKDILLPSPSLRASSLASQIWVDLTRHQYGISALVSPISLSGEASGGIAKCLLFLQAITSQSCCIHHVLSGTE